MRISWASISLVLLLSITVGEAIAENESDRTEIEELAARWVDVVASRDPASYSLLSSGGQAYYPRMREIALYADAEQLRELDSIDQLQAMLLRTLLEPDILESMNAAALLIFAIEHGLVGMDLRALDTLREIAIAGDAATGRLYKFGSDHRPDRSLQYFVREQGSWRIELRGELERLRGDFGDFVERAALPASEAAFFILELRLMRKVMPSDFLAPRARIATAPRTSDRPPAVLPSLPPQLRLVSVRHPLGHSLAPAATIEDRSEGLHYVLVPGDSLPPYPEYRLERIEDDRVVLASEGGEWVLRLGDGGDALTQRLRRSMPLHRDTSGSLLAQAQRGAERAGLMAQWRNIGMRDRPQLLQQAWLTPVYTDDPTPAGRMVGLRVRQLASGSFWQQLGMQNGDLLKSMNGRAVDSMDDWQRVLEVAQNDRAIRITLERASNEIRYQTQTIRPR